MIDLVDAAAADIAPVSALDLGQSDHNATSITGHNAGGLWFGLDLQCLAV